jgi:error-prone DNA polymerase
MGLFAGVDFGEMSPSLSPMTRSEQLVLDYERTGISIAAHPMSLMRAELPKRVRRSTDLVTLAHEAPVEAAGLVICRQRPGTASGVVFITLEDEHGFINLILYARVFEQLRHVATTSSLLLAKGTIERDGGVVYIVTRALRSIALRQAMPSMSRDFH